MATAAQQRASPRGSSCQVVCAQQLEATQTHCSFCFDVLIAHLAGVASPEPDFDDAHWCVEDAHWA